MTHANSIDRIKIFDTSLRDGEQSAGVAFSRVSKSGRSSVIRSLSGPSMR